MTGGAGVSSPATPDEAGVEHALDVRHVGAFGARGELRGAAFFLLGIGTACTPANAGAELKITFRRCEAGLSRFASSRRAAGYS
jgi:hypothetical protein